MPKETIRVLIVDDILETRENLISLLAFEQDIKVVGRGVTGREGVELALQLSPDIILMDINMPDMDGIQAAEQVRQLVPTAGVVMMSVQSEADYLRRAMLAGARDFLTKPISGDDLYSTIRRVYDEMPRRISTTSGSESKLDSGSESKLDGGHIIAIYSPSGGVGVTTIASSIATALAQDGTRVVLVDADLQFGDVGVQLNINSKHSAVDLAIALPDLDDELIDNVLAKHTVLRVLLAPPTPADGGRLDEGDMTEIVKQLALQYDYVIVDTCKYLDDNTLNLLDVAERIVLVGTPVLQSVKNIRITLDLFQALEYPEEKIVFIMNRVNSEARGRAYIPIDAIEKNLKRKTSAHIPLDDRTFLTAQNTGISVVTRNTHQSPAKELMDLAKTVRDSFMDEPKLVEPVNVQSSRLRGLFNRVTADKRKSDPTPRESFDDPPGLVLVDFQRINEQLRLLDVGIEFLHLRNRLDLILVTTAHDIRSPISAVQSTLSYLMKGETQYSPFAQATRLAEATLLEANSFLKISLSEPTVIRRIDVRHLFQRVQDKLAILGRSLIVEGLKEPVEIVTGLDALELALFNLFTVIADWSPEKISIDYNNNILGVFVKPELPSHVSAQFGNITEVDTTGIRLYMVDRSLRACDSYLEIIHARDHTRFQFPLIDVTEPSSAQLRSHQDFVQKNEKRIVNALAQSLSPESTDKLEETYASIVLGFCKQVLSTLKKLSKAIQELLVDLPEQQIELQRMRNNIQFCELLIYNVMLTVSGVNPVHSQIQVKQVIDLIIDLIQRKAGSRTLIADCYPPSLTCNSDETLLKQVLMNLVRNAIDAAPNRGTVMVSAREKNDSVEIQVIDNGSGIPDSHYNHIFKLGFTTKEGGSGIGLYSVQSIVEKLGGKISFTSQPDEGTLFMIDLPSR